MCKGGIKMEHIWQEATGDVDELIFADEEYTVSQR